jgi:transposase
MRYELSDVEWDVINPMLPNKPRGVPRVDDRRVLNGVFWVLRSGTPWRDLPVSYGQMINSSSVRVQTPNRAKLSLGNLNKRFDLHRHIEGQRGHSDGATRMPTAVAEYLDEQV